MMEIFFKFIVAYWWVFLLGYLIFILLFVEGEDSPKTSVIIADRRESTSRDGKMKVEMDTCYIIGSILLLIVVGLFLLWTTLLSEGYLPPL